MKIFVLDSEGKSIDQLMIDAQKVADSLELEETELYRTICKIAPNVDEIVFWYGSDYADLDRVSSVPGRLRKLKEAIRESYCELYIHYKKET